MQATQVKYATHLALGSATLEQQAIASFNRFHFLPALRALLEFEAGVPKYDSKEKEVERGKTEKAMFYAQRDYLVQENNLDPVDMVWFAWVLGNSDLRGAAYKYNASPNKQAFWDLLVQKDKLPKGTAKESFGELVITYYDHDARKFDLAKGEENKRIEAGEVKRGAPRKMNVNPEELL